MPEFVRHTFIENGFNSKCKTCGLSRSARNGMKYIHHMDVDNRSTRLHEPATTPSPRAIFLSEDDKGELLMYAAAVQSPGTLESAQHLFNAVDLIIQDKIKEVLHLIEKQRLARPMNGDGHNYSLGLAEKAIKREFHLEEQ